MTAMENISKHIKDLHDAMIEGKTIAAHDALSMAMHEYHKLNSLGLAEHVKKAICAA